jgi:hypothetical protein
MRYKSFRKTIVTVTSEFYNLIKSIYGIYYLMIKSTNLDTKLKFLYYIDYTL